MPFLIFGIIVDGLFCAVLIGVSIWLIKTLSKPQIAALLVMVLQGLAIHSAMALPFLLWYSDNLYDNFSYVFADEPSWGLVINLIYGSAVGLMTYRGTHLQLNENSHSSGSTRTGIKLLWLSWFLLTLGLACAHFLALVALGGK